MTAKHIFAIVLSLLLFPPKLSAHVYVVSPQGVDSQPGTKSATLQTIQAAANRAVAGDTILVLEGVYRERVTPPRGGIPGRPIVYRGEPGKRVVIKGSEVWRTEWRAEEAGIFSAHPDDELFDDRSAEYVDDYNPLKVELASTPWHREGKRENERGFGGDQRLTYTCGQVFIDGKPLLEVPFRDELQPGAWWYDAEEERVYVHFGQRKPAECNVELTTRRRLFAPHKRGLGHIVVEGFVFEHCGNQYPTNFWENDANAQRGAVGTEAGHDWIIRHNVIRYVKTFALDVGRVDAHTDENSAYNNLVEENYILENGSAGIMSCGSRNLVIRSNVILRNNRLQFLGKKRWEQAGIKCHWFKEGLIQGNYIAHNFDTYGIWLDNQFPDSRISGNVIHDNGRAGIFLEMSDYGYDRLLVDNNLIFDNHENAVYIHDASGATFANNLLANTHDTKGYGQAVYIRQVGARTKTYHHSFFGNLLIGNARNVEINYPAVRSGPQRFDYNLYDIDSLSKSFAVSPLSDVPLPWTDAEFRKLILSDLGLEEDSFTLQGWPRKAVMSHNQWQEFWHRHGEHNDVHSLCVKGNSVAYDPDNHVLTVALKALPPKYDITEKAADSENRSHYDSKSAGCETSSFLNSLKRGMNKSIVWDGLPIVRSGELPPIEWTNLLHSK